MIHGLAEVNRGFDVHADAIVVGSGAGGAVAAANLARAGLRTVVVEAGPRLTPADMTRDAPTFMARYYWEGGLRMLGGTTRDPDASSALSGRKHGGQLRHHARASGLGATSVARRDRSRALHEPRPRRGLRARLRANAGCRNADGRHGSPQSHRARRARRREDERLGAPESRGCLRGLRGLLHGLRDGAKAVARSVLRS